MCVIFVYYSVLYMCVMFAILIATNNKSVPQPTKQRRNAPNKKILMKGSYIVAQVKNYDKNRIIEQVKRENRQKRMG